MPGDLISGHRMRAGTGEGLDRLSSQCSPHPQEVTEVTFHAMKFHVCQYTRWEQSLETWLP